MRKIISIILFLHLSKFFVFAPPLPYMERTNVFNDWVEKIQHQEMYEKVIQNLKQSEGLRLSPYLCPAGYLTIGYGHRIRKGEHFTKITRQEAEGLLKKDFNVRLASTEPHLPYNKRLAITHFIFNVGQSAYHRSTLKKLIHQNKPINSEIMKWVHYRRHGVIYISKNLKKAREFELNLFYNV